MPKRKRGHEVAEDPHKEVEAKIVHGKKILNRALKLAKNFERQKIDKRIKVAEKEGDAKKERIQREGEALKDLDVSQIVDAHLHKTLLKTKTIVESGLLPAFVVLPQKNASFTAEQALAYDNVTARMYNTKPVKDAMKQIMDSVYAAVGAPNPASKKVKGAETTESRSNNEQEHELQMPSTRKRSRKDAGIEWDGFESGSEADTESDEEEDFAGFEARIVASSDESSAEDDFELTPYKGDATVKTLSPRDLSITPETTPSRSPTPGLSDASGAEEEEEEEEEVASTKASKPTKSKNEVLKKPAATTFLPTLMGGYWSGSESSASEIDEKAAAPPRRKNRRGQQARRAIAEKKYGDYAKHIKAGQAPADTTGERKRQARIAERMGKTAPKGKGANDGWDPRRGAIGERSGFKRTKDTVTGENAAPLGERKKPKHRDDAGALHASWEAAKKAKEVKANAKFEGKKVVFD